jgi:NADPH:quinone reductase-like Zn-dependent oxidoreductase
MPQVVVFDEFGGPDVMHIVDDPISEPATGEVRVMIEAFAVNPLDQIMRSGTSPAPVPLPHARLGVEGTGVIDAAGTRYHRPAGRRSGHPHRHSGRRRQRELRGNTPRSRQAGSPLGRPG